MNYNNFNFTDGRVIITLTKKEYSRTASGKSWKTKPDAENVENVAAAFYTNYIKSVPFFNNFGGGAYCRAQYNYTPAGYLPTTITTVSPEQNRKIVAVFTFKYN